MCYYIKYIYKKFPFITARELDYNKTDNSNSLPSWWIYLSTNIIVTETLLLFWP